MGIKDLPVWVIMAMIFAACSPRQKTPAAASQIMAGTGNSSMSTGNMGMTITATPGSMKPTNPEAAHMMEPITAPNVQPATQTQGSQPLSFKEQNGVKVFELTAQAVQWPILEDVSVTAYTYNGTVPGPMIRVTEGDQVRVIVKNELPDPTTIHWHGVEVPNAMDGVPGMTQEPIQPGEILHLRIHRQTRRHLYVPFALRGRHSGWSWFICPIDH